MNFLQLDHVLKNLAAKVLNNGARIIGKDDTEVYISKGERAEVMQILHATHVSDDTMIRQYKTRLYLPLIFTSCTKNVTYGQQVNLGLKYTQNKYLIIFSQEKV